MALTFQLKNRLLQGLNDDPVAFNIAAEWVDTEEKLVIFERQFGRAGDLSHTYPPIAYRPNALEMRSVTACAKD